MQSAGAYVGFENCWDKQTGPPSSGIRTKPGVQLSVRATLFLRVTPCFRFYRAGRLQIQGCINWPCPWNLCPGHLCPGHLVRSLWRFLPVVEQHLWGERTWSILSAACHRQCRPCFWRFRWSVSSGALRCWWASASKLPARYAVSGKWKCRADCATGPGFFLWACGKQSAAFCERHKYKPCQLSSQKG